MSNQKVKEELPFHEEQIKQATQLIERQQIKGTPFWAIGNNKEGWNLIMGKYKLNATTFQTNEELQQWISKDQWNITLSIAICVATDIINQYKQTQNQNNEHN